MHSCGESSGIKRSTAVFRIIAAQLVSPNQKRGASGKDDANDAAAICEAAGRPQMHFVPVKTIEQQIMLCVHRLREGWARTQRPARVRAGGPAAAGLSPR